MASVDSSFTGHAAGLISPERWAKYQRDRDAVEHGTDILKSTVLSPQVCEQLFVPYDFLMRKIALGEVWRYGNKRWQHEEAGVYQILSSTFLTTLDSAFDMLSRPSVTLDHLVDSGAIQDFPEFEPHIITRIVTDGELQRRVCALIAN